MEDKLLILGTFSYLKGLKKVKKSYVSSKINSKDIFNYENTEVIDNGSQVKTKNGVKLPKKAIKIFEAWKNINGGNPNSNIFNSEEKKKKTLCRTCKKMDLIQPDIPDQTKFENNISKALKTNHFKNNAHFTSGNDSSNEEKIHDDLENDQSQEKIILNVTESTKKNSDSFQVFNFSKNKNISNEIISSTINNIPEKVQDWINHLSLKDTSQETCTKVINSKLEISENAFTNSSSLPALFSREESIQSNSSLDSLLDSRKPDPVEIFLNLGFGGVPGVDMEICRIPQRFLVPSKCKGGNWNEFLKRELLQAQNFECSSLGFRGLSGPSHRRPSAIVANIMEKLRERSISQPCCKKSRFTKIYSSEKTSEGKLCVEFQSVLSPDNRKFLQSQGKISPEVPRRRIIFGQKSFAFGRDGEFVEVSSSPAKSITNVSSDEVLINQNNGKSRMEPTLLEKSIADNLLKYRRGSFQKQKRVVEDSLPPHFYDESNQKTYYPVEEQKSTSENYKSESAALKNYSKKNVCNSKIPHRFLSSTNLKFTRSDSNLTEMMRQEIEKEIRILSHKIKDISDQELISVLKQLLMTMGAALCGGGQYLQSQGSVLDRVISQASNKDDCLLYKLANYKNGGELIEAYNIGGQVEVEKLIKEQFGVLMYANGKGEVIKRAEYLRWKFRDQAQVVLPIEASLSIYDPLAKWEDHEACWQMQYRGSLGETLLHVLIICDSKIHTKLARTLLKCFPKLALDIVEGEEYLGASALHLAIAYSNNELVKDLVDAGANISQRAVGSFFLPKDQQRAKPSKTTDYEGLAYLGEYPLAWAACCSNESVYNLLLDVGANPDSQDSFGNMILHMVVVCDKLDMFGYALRHPKVPASNGIINNEGLTPLTLACKLGRADVFKEMLELSAKEFWRYSNITCSAYPLNALDTLLPDGRTNWNSAIFIILNGTKQEHLDMLDGGIIQRLLEEKWKTFARGQFLKRLAILFLHIFFLSGSVYLRPDDRNHPLLAGRGIQDIVRYCFEICTIIGVLCYLCFQQGDEIRNQGLLSFLKQLPHDPAKFIFLISNLLILACIPYRLADDIDTEEAILVFAVPGSWFLLMFFAGAIRLTGPFVTMIYSMITGDMLTFGIIYSVFLFGFSQSFYFLYKGSKNVSTSLFSSYLSTWMALFQVTMGDYNYNDLALTAYPAISKMVFTIFMILVPILLLNMLIAMMGNTYAHVIEQSEKEWMKQWAKIVVALERAVNQINCHHYLQEYSIKLGPGDDPSTEQRGVLVIKSKSKTRAKQRKGALCNWKRVGKVTIKELHKRGMTGEQLRRLMWGRASISTPVKPVPIKLKDLASVSNNLDISASDASVTGVKSNGAGLLAALNVMAFANDIEFNKTSNAQNFPQPSTFEEDFVSDFSTSDPLRCLVIIAEDQEKNKTVHVEDKIYALAQVAANNEGLEEIPPKIFEYGWIQKLNFDSTDVKKKDFNLNSELLHFFTPDLSDSDGFGDELLLGKSYRRLKRTRSVNTKQTSLGNNIPTKKALLSSEDSSSTQSDDLTLLNQNFDNKKTEFGTFSQIQQPNGSLSNQILKFNPKSRKKSKLIPAQNRIAPAESMGYEKISAAVDNSDISRSTTPANILVQWSTRDIANINTLLASGDGEESI